MAVARWLAVVWLAAVAVPSASAAPDADIVVHVRKDGPEIVVEADCPVRAPSSVVWEVLTDYDNMSRFLSHVQYSSVRSRIENVLTVRQIGRTSRGPISFAFDNVREVELRPYTEIRSRLLSGDLKAFAFTTRIVEAGDIVHIVNSGRYTPNHWIPPVIGPPLIEAETRNQLAEVRAEILRRSERRAAGLALP
ncbi:MAG: SRPBCC family protein [Betaproteobacteria bacterium]